MNKVSNVHGAHVAHKDGKHKRNKLHNNTFVKYVEKLDMGRCLRGYCGK